jgi:hypothetical protein
VSILLPSSVPPAFFLSFLKWEKNDMLSTCVSAFKFFKGFTGFYKNFYEGQTDMRKLLVAFRNFANAPKKQVRFKNHRQQQATTVQVILTLRRQLERKHFLG